MSVSMFRLAAAALPIALIAAAPAGPRWDTYANARYSYEACYPADLLIPQPEADAGDGRAFIGADGTQLRVWGQFNALDRTLAQARAADRSAREGEGWAVTYSAMRGNWYVLSGRSTDRLFYARTTLAHGRFISFDLRYPAGAAARWSPLVARIARCLSGN